MDPKELAGIVRSEIKAVEDVLRTHISDEVAKKYSQTEAAFAEIRTELTKLQVRGVDEPGAVKVVDLEKRLVTAEQIVKDLVTRANAVAIQVDASRSREDRDIKLFRGVFFKDAEEFVKRLNTVRGNEEAMVRAIDTTLFSTGGKLSPETADRFLDFVLEKTVALRRVTTRRMNSPEAHTDELTIAARKLRRATETTEPATAEAMGTKRRTMTTVETVWPEDISLSFLEDNIERRGAESHIMMLLSRQYGSDLNDLAWNGDTAADVSQDDAFLSINDGWIKLALADPLVNDFDASAATTNSGILSDMFQLLPVEFKGLLDLGYFVPVPFAEEYADELSRRETNLGDQVMVQGFQVMRYFGWPVIAEPHLYEDNLDRAMLTPLANLHHGIQRQITVDSEWRPRKRAIEVTITARNDYEYATGKGIVLTSNIPAANR